LEVVALLADLPVQRLARGQAGTVVEQLDDKRLLVEFSDDQGSAYAIAPCQRGLAHPALRPGSHLTVERQGRTGAFGGPRRALV
jgi:Domain of unknown function (DUF4926)